MSKKKPKEQIQIKGEDIRWVHTGGSMYDNDCLIVGLMDESQVRLPASLVKQMAKFFSFSGEKAIKHFYLKEAHLYD